MAKRRPSVPKMKGVEALISQSSKLQEKSPLNSISINLIQLSKAQPRRYFDPEKLENLAQSIKEHGILEPLLVRPIGNGKYELIAGERRLRAAKSLNLLEVPVSIKDVDELEATHIALIENLQRDDLNPVEETEGILRLLSLTLQTSESEICSLLHKAFNAKQRGNDLNDNVTIQLENIERTLSGIGSGFNAESFRTNRLPLLNLPTEILEELRKGTIQYTKARAIARIKETSIRGKLLEKAIIEELSLTAIKQEIEKILKASDKKKTQREEKFINRVQEVSRKLKSAELWKDVEKRKKAEVLLDDLEKLIGS